MSVAPANPSPHGLRSPPVSPGLGRFAALRWLPVPLLLIAVIFFRVLGSARSVELPYLLIGLNIVFATLVSIVVAFLVGRSFIVQGTLDLLGLGLGMLIWGTASLVAPLLGRKDPNALTSIHNCGVWLAGLCLLSGILASLRPVRVRMPGPWLLIAQSMGIGAVVLVSSLAVGGHMPEFFIQGRGGTPVRQLVLTSAAGMLVLGAVLLKILAGRFHSEFLQWYVPAMVLLAVGLIGVLVQPSTGSSVGWTGRSAQFLGGVYMLIAAIASVRQSRTWGISLSEALRQSEDRYRVLVDATFEGVAVTEAGRVVDANEPLLAMLGYAREELIGMEVASLVAPEDRARVLANIQTGTASSLEHDLLRKDTTRITVEAHGKTVELGGRRIRYTALRDVTQRRRTEQALAESRERLRLAASAARLFAFEWDPATDWVRREGDAPAILGVPAQEELGQSYFARVHPEDRQRFTDLLRSLCPQRDSYTTTYRVMRPGGGESVLEESGRAFFDDRGRFSRLIGMTADITQRRQAEELLRRSEARWSTAIETFAAGAIIATEDEQVIYWNPAAQAMHGLAHMSEGIGPLHDTPLTFELWTLDGFHRLELDEWPMRRIKRGERVQNLELRVRRPDQGWEKVFSYSGAMVDTVGGERLIFLSIHDLTEQRRAEEALSRAKQRLDAHMEHSPLAVIEWGPDMRITRWSKEAERVFGWTAQEVLGKGMWDFRWVHEEDTPHVADVSKKLQKGVQRFSANRNYRKDGTTVLCHWYNSTLLDDQEQFQSILSLVLDVTEQDRMERALREAKQAAELASRAKDQFIAVLSHELRTPLTPAAALSLLCSDMRLPGDVREDLELVRRNIDLEVRLIADLLDVSRIISGKLHLEKRSIDVADTIREAAAIVSGDLDAKGQTLMLDLPDTPARMMGDAARLQQVFWNLLRNAIKFSPERSQILVRARREPVNGSGDGDDPADAGILAVEIIDQGCGIAPPMLPRLFNAFEQDQKARSFGGLGLGLSICRGVVEMHGGSICAHSDGIGCGAIFVVRLPVQARLAEASAVSGGGTSLSPGQAPLHNRRGLRILLVEDHADTAKLVCRLLIREGHQVVTAGSVAEGLTQAIAHPPDLMISDMGLPDGSGLDLMNELVAQGRRIPAIALSGFGSPADIENSMAAGFAEHLVKPLSGSEPLRAAIARLHLQARE